MDTNKDLEKYLEYNYPIEIKYISSEDGGGVLATISFLGEDAFVGDGETVEEAIKNLNRVKRELFEYYIKNNIKIPPPPGDEFSGKFVLRVPRLLHRELVKQAEENGVSLNTYCVFLLGKRLELASFENMGQRIKLDVEKIFRREIIRYYFDSVKMESGGVPVNYFRGKHAKSA